MFRISANEVVDELFKALVAVDLALTSLFMSDDQVIPLASNLLAALPDELDKVVHLVADQGQSLFVNFLKQFNQKRAQSFIVLKFK